MRRPQRIVLGVYCLSLVYCFVWIPWCVTNNGRYGTDRERLGYGWLWGGPQYPKSQIKSAEPNVPFSDVDQFVNEQVDRRGWDSASPYASPDMILMAFRVLALSLSFMTVFVLVGHPKQRPNIEP